MRNVLLSLFMLLLTFTMVEASELLFRPQDKSFLKQWAISARYHQQKGNQTASVQVFERSIRYAGESYTVGSLTYLEFPKVGELSQREIVSGLQTGYDVQEWRTKRVANELIVEGDWKVGSRVVRLAIKEEKNRYYAVTTVYRKGYEEPLAIESFILERKLLQSSKKTVHHFAPDILLDFIMPKAHAQSIPSLGGQPTDFLNIGNILDNISPADLAGTNITNTGGGTSFIPDSSSLTNIVTSGGNINADVNIGGNVRVDGDIKVDATTTVDAIDRSLAGRIDQVDGILDTRINQVDGVIGDRLNQTDKIINDGLDRVDGQLDKALKQADETTKMVDQNWKETNRIADDALKQADETTKMVDKNWQETNRQAARANDTAAKLADPKHMFLLAGATAAGSVVGGFVANMAIQGLMTGVDWMIEQMTGKKAAAERWRQFQDARRQWDKTLENALKLENAIDNFILFHETLKTLRDRLPESERKNLSMDKILELFGREILLKEKRRKELYDMFMKAEGPACEQVFATELTQMDGVIKNMNQVLQVLQDHKSANPNIDIFDERYFCSQMDHMMRNLVDAESTLQRYRLHLINGQAEWRKEVTSSVDELQDVTNRLSNDGDAIMKKEVQAARDLYERNYTALRERLRKECKDTGLMFTGGCVDQKMKNTNMSEYQTLITRRDQAIERASKDAARRTGRPVTVNPDIEYDRLRAHQDWFEELEDQQFCSKNPDDKRCQKLAEFRYNGVFYVKERGYKKIDEVCSDQRLTLDRVEEGFKEEQKALEEKQGRAPASSDTSVKPAKESGGGKGFFASIFGAIGDFFRSIGEFLGLVSPKTVGEAKMSAESLETVVPESRTRVTDTERARVPATVSSDDIAVGTPADIENESILGEIVNTEGTSAIKSKLENNTQFVEVLAGSGLPRQYTGLLTNDIAEILAEDESNNYAVDVLLEKMKDDEETRSKVEKIYSTAKSKGLRQYLLTQVTDNDPSELTAKQAALEANIAIKFNIEADFGVLKDLRGVSYQNGQLNISANTIAEEKKTSEFYRIIDEMIEFSKLPNDEKDRDTLNDLLEQLKSLLG